MTISALTVDRLKKAKNSVIGNPLAKVQLVQDQVFVAQLISCLNPESLPFSGAKGAQESLRIEAAHVVASLSYGSEEALGVLLRGNAHHAFFYAISRLTETDPPALRAAFSRALRAFISSLADNVGPSLWGLKPETSSIRSEAEEALSQHFQHEFLDIYLPLLVPPTSTPNLSVASAVATSTAQMIACTTRTAAQRQAVTEWRPATDRHAEIKSRRGWEKTSNGSASVPWVARQLLSLLRDRERERDSRLIESVLSALAALSKENPAMANSILKASGDGPHPITTIINFTKSRSIDIQLAACLCLTNTLRATSHSIHPSHSHPSSHPPNASHGASTLHRAPSHGSLHPTSMHGASVEENCIRTIINVINRLISSSPATDLLGASTSTMNSPQTKAKACFILHYLVHDDPSLCHAAFDRGCLEHVGSLIKEISSRESSTSEWDEDEPESVLQLREASLTALASLALRSDDIRRRVTDELRLLPFISRALRVKKHIGTRYAACQCVRALSRAVLVLRTGIVDSGLGMDVLRIVLGKDLNEKSGSALKGRDGKQRESNITEKTDDAMDVVDSTVDPKIIPLNEDRRVLSAALSAVCNIVNDFSPLRPIYLEEKLMPRLVYILRQSDDSALRLNALWAVKNLVRKTSTETKRDIMNHLGWHELLQLLEDPVEDIQEQGFNILRNLAENEEGIAMVFRELGIQILGKLINGMKSHNDDVVLQSTFALANLSNGTPDQQDLIVKFPQLLPTLQCCLSESNASIRRPAVSCVLTLTKKNPRRRKDMAEAGIVGTLKRICEWSGHAAGLPHAGHHGHGHSASISGLASLHPNPPSVALAPGGWAGHPSWGPGFGSWGGTGTLHHHYHNTTVHQAHITGHQASSHSMVPDDDRDVVQTARVALDWLESGDTYT
ncbi:armadillo-type protein [Crepidotus variabilis]|uniref:Armadillo-type protein n=1 Tax=Crepidotus variabilis TaxID=179855 RepID=A0A9P6EKV1_9AGAR|nr:armadillo-type protein [Crepidotus variabilis]